MKSGDRERARLRGDIQGESRNVFEVSADIFKNFTIIKDDNVSIVVPFCWRRQAKSKSVQKVLTRFNRMHVRIKTRTG